jgi:phage terminase small subunit
LCWCGYIMINKNKGMVYEYMIRNQHMLLCEEHIRLNFSNAAEAARRAGYKDSPTVYAKASQILSRPECKEYIEKRIKEMLSETDKMTLEWLRNVRKIMNADMRRVLKWGRNKPVEFVDPEDISDEDAYAISEVSETDSGKKIKLESKIKSLELLGKYLAILGDHRADDESEEKKLLEPNERKERINYLLNKSNHTKK